MAFEKTRYLEASRVRAYYPPDSSRLRVELQDEMSLPRALVKLAFPLSNPDNYLVIQDAEGKEVGVIKGLDGMDAESIEAIRKELDRRYFTPKILAIRGLKQDGGMWRFTVDTQRGPCDFWVRHWRDSSAEIQPGRWQIITVDGQRFEIPNINGLDPRSSKLLEQLL